MNACQDSMKVYRSELSGQRGTTNILAPSNLKLLPLYILALLKFVSICLIFISVTLLFCTFGLLRTIFQQAPLSRSKIYTIIQSLIPCLKILFGLMVITNLALHLFLKYI